MNCIKRLYILNRDLFFGGYSCQIYQIIFLKNIFYSNKSRTKYCFFGIIIRDLIIKGLFCPLFLSNVEVDKIYIIKVVEDILVDGMSKLEIKTDVYSRLDKKLRVKYRLHFKILEYEFNNLRIMKWNSRII